MRTRHYRPRTIGAYVQWTRGFILFHNKTHPAELGKEEIGGFLTYLAVERDVSPSTQNQALKALLLLSRDVVQTPVGWIDDIPRQHALYCVC